MAVNPIHPDNKPDKSQITSDVSKSAHAKSDEKKESGSLSKSVIVFFNSTQLNMLDETLNETGSNSLLKIEASSINPKGESQVNSLGAGENGPIDTGGDIVNDMQDLVDAINNKEYLSDPEAFYQKLLKVGIDISEVTNRDLQESLIKELKGELSALFKSEEAKEALAKAIAQAYNDLSKSSEDVGQLRNVLSLLFGSSSTLIDRTISLYTNAIATGGSVEGVVESYERAGEAIEESKTWENRLDDLLNSLKKGDIDFQKLMGILEEGFAQLDELDPESNEYKQLMEKMEKLTKAITPLVDNPAARGRFAEMLSLYFAQENDPAGSESRAEQFLNKLVPFYVKDLDHSVEDPHYQNLVDLLNQTKEKMKGAEGPFDPENPMSQNEIDALLKGNSSVFNKLVGVAIKNYDILHNKPIFMALFVLLMSQDGAYGYLAQMASDIELTMKKVGEISDSMTDLTNKISDFMEEKDPLELQKIAKEISDLQKEMNELIEKNKDSISPELLERLKKFLEPGSGSIEDVLIDSAIGISSWEELAEDQTACEKLQEYLTATEGGGVKEGVNTLMNAISQLQGALNVQSQGHLEKFNMTTKKVDALTKLFSAFVTAYKSIIQAHTQYSGS